MNKVLFSALVVVLVPSVFADGDFLKSNDNVVSKSNLSSVKAITPVKSLSSSSLLKSKLKKVSLKNKLSLGKLNKLNKLSLNKFSNLNKLSLKKFSKLSLSKFNKLNLSKSGLKLKKLSLGKSLSPLSSGTLKSSSLSLKNLSKPSFTSSTSSTSALSTSKSVISTSSTSKNVISTPKKKSEIHDVTKPVPDALAYSLLLQDNIKGISNYIKGSDKNFKFKTDVTLYKNPQYAALTQLINKAEEYLHPKKWQSKLSINKF